MTKQNIKVMLRAFNGEVDAAVAKVTWNNVTRMEERIRKACDAINATGTANKIALSQGYLDLALAELRLTYEYERKKQAEQGKANSFDEKVAASIRAQAARKGIEYGSITLHPDGIPHGPHPGRVEQSLGQKRTDELAVMLDSFRPLRAPNQAISVEDQGYPTSWLEEQ